MLAKNERLLKIREIKVVSQGNSEKLKVVRVINFRFYGPLKNGIAKK